MSDSSPFFKNVAMYLRKSRAEEGEDTEVVLARHKAQLMQYADAHKANVARIYEEVVSGDSLFARPRMLELLNDIESYKFSGVLCTDIDRLGRGNMKEQGLILETLKDTGTAIITPDKIYDLNNELDETQSEFKTFMARQELKIIKKRLSRGIRLTIEKGGYVSNVPFGYARAYKDRIPTLSPDPEESKYVQMIFKLYIEGDGCQTICRKLTAMGIKPHRGDEFSRNSIRRILTNPVYIGKIVWGQKKHLRPKKIGEVNKTIYIPKEQWQIFDGLHPAIIDEETFNRANMILHSRYHHPYRESGQISNPLAGLLVCRKCGHALTRRSFGKRGCKIDYLLCPTAGCIKSSRADYVEKALLNELESKLRDLEITQDSDNASSDVLQSKTILENMCSELSKLQKRRNRLYDLLEQGTYSAEVFKNREMLLTKNINSIAENIKSMKKDLNFKQERAQITMPKIEHVLQEYWNGTPAEKNELLKSAVRRVLYYKPKSANSKEFVIDIELR